MPRCTLVPSLGLFIWRFPEVGEEVGEAGGVGPLGAFIARGVGSILTSGGWSKSLRLRRRGDCSCGYADKS